MAAPGGLDLNGFDCLIDDGDPTAMELQMAEGKMPKPEIARFFSFHMKR
ncbi:MAG: hypothetical protein MJ025_05285 [Victivallaceae bacterium]|nr:hypothetical protein [Victivallaceae bacterium]